MKGALSKPSSLQIAAVFLVLTLSFLWSQDRVTYEGGKEEIGKVIRQDANEIVLRVQGVEKTIPKNEIKQIQLDYIKDKHFLEAKELLETSVKRFQDTDANKLLLIKAAFKVKDYPTAQKNIAAGKGHPYQLMRSYLVLKKSGGAEALKILKQIPEKNLLAPEVIDLQILLAFAHADTKNLSEASKLLKKIEAKYPGDTQNQFTLLALNRDLPSFLKEMELVQKELAKTGAGKKSWETLQPNLAQFYRDTEDKKLIDLEQARPMSVRGGGMGPTQKTFAVISVSSFGASAILGLTSGLMQFQTIIARETYLNAKTDIDARFAEWQAAQFGTVFLLASAGTFALGGLITGLFSLLLPERDASVLQVSPELRHDGLALRLSHRF